MTTNVIFYLSYDLSKGLFIALKWTIFQLLCHGHYLRHVVIHWITATSYDKCWCLSTRQNVHTVIDITICLMVLKAEHQNPEETRMMFIKHYAPNRWLCIKVAKSTMFNWLLGWGLQRYHKGRGEGGYVQRKEVIVKRKKSQGGGGCQGTSEWRSEAFVKIKKKNIFFFFFFWGGGSVWGGGGGGGGSGWMWTEKWSYCENSKKKNLGGVGLGGSGLGGGWGGSGQGGGVGLGGGGQGGWERRSEAFVKIQKNIYFFWGGVGSGGGGRVGGVRVDGNREVKLVWKFKRKNCFFWGGWGSGWGGGVRVDVNGEVKLLWKFKKK